MNFGSLELDHVVSGSINSLTVHHQLLPVSCSCFKLGLKFYLIVIVQISLNGPTEATTRWKEEPRFRGLHPTLESGADVAMFDSRRNANVSA